MVSARPARVLRDAQAARGRRHDEHVGGLAVREGHDAWPTGPFALGLVVQVGAGAPEYEAASAVSRSSCAPYVLADGEVRHTAVRRCVIESGVGPIAVRAQI
jgi:hypothetical protein